MQIFKWIVTIERPNSMGVIFKREYDTYPENWIESRCERLADSGWDLVEIDGSSTTEGTIECVHDNEADAYLIKWTKQAA